MIVLLQVGIVLVVIILQTTLAEFVADLIGAKPDLYLLTAIGFGLLRGKRAGVGFGWVLGLIQDGLSGGLLGQNAISKGLTGFVAGVLRRNLGEMSTIAQVLMAVLATLFDTGIHLGTLSLIYGVPVGTGVLATVGLAVVLNGVLAPGVIWVVRNSLNRFSTDLDQMPLGRPR